MKVGVLDHLQRYQTSPISGNQGFWPFWDLTSVRPPRNGLSPERGGGVAAAKKVHAEKTAAWSKAFGNWTADHPDGQAAYNKMVSKKQKASKKASQPCFHCKSDTHIPHKTNRAVACACYGKKKKDGKWECGHVKPKVVLPVIAASAAAGSAGGPLV